MGIYLSLHPALYREWLIALFPPIHRDLVRDVLADLADSLRAYIVGQVLTMTFLGAITGLGLYVLAVPFWLPFGIFTGLVVVVGTPAPVGAHPPPPAARPATSQGPSGALGVVLAALIATVVAAAVTVFVGGLVFLSGVRPFRLS